MHALCVGSLDEKLELCFKVFDAESKGYLTLAEMRNVSGVISRLLYGTDNPEVADAEADQMFLDMDRDKDNKVPHQIWLQTIISTLFLGCLVAAVRRIEYLFSSDTFSGSCGTDYQLCISMS